jgi:hypothetical protein
LDLARYADSDGYEKDRPRPFAFQYRNWVIAALNADMPYDFKDHAQLEKEIPQQYESAKAMLAKMGVKKPQ